MAAKTLWSSTADTTVTTGTGTLTGVGVAPSSDYRAPTAAGVPNGTFTSIRIEDGTQWETCETTITLAVGVYTYSRGTLLASSTGSRINFSTGTANIYFAADAEDFSVNALTTLGDLLVHNGTHPVCIGVGTNGYPLVADSGQTNGVGYGTTAVPVLAGGTGATTAAGARTNLGIVNGQNLDVAIIASAHYSVLNAKFASGAQLAASCIIAYSFRITRSMTLTGMSIWVGTGVASSKCQIGIYTDSGGKPSARLCATGDLTTTSSTTVVQGAVSVTLTPGVYWAVVQTFSAPPNPFTYDTNSGAQPQAWSRVANSVAQGVPGYYLDSNAYAALPDPYPIGSPTFTIISATNLKLPVITLDT